jgi:hypothetical protein
VRERAADNRRDAACRGYGAFRSSRASNSDRDCVTSMLESSRRRPRELLSERGVLADDVAAIDIDGRIVDLQTPVDPAAQLRPVRNARLVRHAYIGVLGD